LWVISLEAITHDDDIDPSEKHLWDALQGSHIASIKEANIQGFRLR